MTDMGLDCMDVLRYSHWVAKVDGTDDAGDQDQRSRKKTGLVCPPRRLEPLHLRCLCAVLTRLVAAAQWPSIGHPHS